MEINQEKLEKALAEELLKFKRNHEKSEDVNKKGKRQLLFGVPMNWMQRWPGAFPLTIAKAEGAEIFDIDDNRYADFCLGNSSAIAGHNPQYVIDAVRRQMEKGSVYALPTESAYRVGEKLKERFGLPIWGFSLSSSDASRSSIRISREVTKRKKTLIFDGCYHGAVDECMAECEDGRQVVKKGNIGNGIDLSVTTTVIPFNDIEALERELRTEKYACLLMEPVMINAGMIHPGLGFLEACSKLTKDTGTVWILDETHTITAGPGGYSKREELEPDMLVLGKGIAGGISVGCYGMREEIANKLYAATKPEYAESSGIGGTIIGSPLAMTAIEATLEHHLTEANFEKSKLLAKEFCSGAERVFKRYQIPFTTNRLGCRAEYIFSKRVARNAEDSRSYANADLYTYLFVGTLNRGILMSPYLNIMAIFTTDTKMSDVKRHEEILDELLGKIV